MPLKLSESEANLKLVSDRRKQSVCLKPTRNWRDFTPSFYKFWSRRHFFPKDFILDFLSYSFSITINFLCDFKVLRGSLRYPKATLKTPKNPKDRAYIKYYELSN